ARELADPARREALYRRAQALYREDAPWVPLVYPTTAIASQARVIGLRVSPFGLNNYANVDVR
ncbi:hypothetical protein Q6264_29340, partial [Klebsiella pneumoniae]|nr:hypothetical protein [Klebsiella pneumoniae]